MGTPRPTSAQYYEKVVLDSSVTYPMELEVAPDGRVFFVERDGPVKVWEPATGRSRQIAFLPTDDLIEDGLLGIELDPEFPSNGWIYLYYTPRDGAPNRLSRFTLRDGRLDRRSEIVMLEVPVQREKCCHSAGSLEFGPDGNLFLSTGDNTHGPDEADNSIDERPGHYLSDAQRTTANTNDLRGKILRIRPLDDGSYAIPEGNLFPDTPKTRPEIYTMGHRNPWRIGVDPKTGWLYWGDVGPGNAGREGYAPPAYDEFNLAREPGFFGWPYFTGPNAAYRDKNLANGEWGEMPDPAAPINDSPNNTGRVELPPADSAWIWYSYGPSERFPGMGTGGMSAAAGPTYYHPGPTAHEHALPDSLDGRVFLFEWARHWIRTVSVGERGQIEEIHPFADSLRFRRPADLTIGPGGRLFVLEWGSRFWGSTRDAKLVRIDYVEGARRPPEARLSCTPSAGPVPLEVHCSSGHSHRNGYRGTLRRSWSVDGEELSGASGVGLSHRFEEPGRHRITVRVADSTGSSSSARRAVTAGNERPQVRLAWPVPGGFFDYGRPVPVRTAVRDPAGAVERSGAGSGSRSGAAAARSADGASGSATVRTFLGHNTHRHRDSVRSEIPVRDGRAAGTVTVRPDSTHAPYVLDRYALLRASYADAGTPELSDSVTVRLNPRRMQAEHARTIEGADVQVTANRQDPLFTYETEVFVELSGGDRLAYRPVSLRNVDGFALRYRALRPAEVELRLDRPDGRLLGGATLLPAGAEPDSTWRSRFVTLDDPGRPHRLVLVVRADGEEDALELDRLTARGVGMHAPPPPRSDP